MHGDSRQRRGRLKWRGHVDRWRRQLNADTLCGHMTGPQLYSTANVWLVFEEDAISCVGYKIAFDEEERIFGPASVGFPEDKHPVMCGWHGTFVTTFLGM